MALTVLILACLFAIIGAFGVRRVAWSVFWMLLWIVGGFASYIASERRPIEMDSQYFFGLIVLPVCAAAVIGSVVSWLWSLKSENTPWTPDMKIRAAISACAAISVITFIYWNL
jgi:uncharacterized membrane protein HdeD (DUF308 family)